MTMINLIKHLIPTFCLLLYFYSCSSTRNVDDSVVSAKITDSIDVGNITTNDSNPPPDYVEVIKQPQPINPKAPSFPEELRRSGINGTVWVKLWITKTGEVKRAIVLQTDDQKLNRAALDAAITWRFSPAVDVNGNNRDVWVSIPFKFRTR